MMDNYFRVGRHTFLFQSRNRESAFAAWNRAMLRDKPIAVYRPFSTPGPWLFCDVIGFPTLGTFFDITKHNEDKLEPALAMARWEHRAALRQQLWTFGTNHVNSDGHPTV